MCFGGERRLGVRLRRARGLMGRDEGKIAIFPSSLSMRPRARLNLIPNLLSSPKTLKWRLGTSLLPRYNKVSDYQKCFDTVHSSRVRQIKMR